jgi:hypothetical protein
VTALDDEAVHIWLERPPTPLDWAPILDRLEDFADAGVGPDHLRPRAHGPGPAPALYLGPQLERRGAPRLCERPSLSVPSGRG